jgi:polysaccharide chain length determinant protein (PEP-CTERM system associated)
MNQVMTNPGMEQLLAFWDSVRHHRGWIALGTVLLSLLGTTLILLLPDHYKATTTILVDPQRVPEKYVSPTVSSDPAQRLSTLSDQVLSSTRLQKIIDDMHLYPELRGWLSREQIIEAMRKDLTVKVKEGSSAGLSSFSIEYEGRDRQQVAQVANQLAASFIEWNVKSRSQQAQDTTEFLTAQLQEAKRSLEDQEKKVSTFKMQHLGEMPEQQPANLQVLSQLQAQFQANAEAQHRLEVERTLLVRGLEPATTGGPQPTAPPLTERGRLEAERHQLKDQIFDLKRRYTESHPEVLDAEAHLQRVEQQLKSLPPDPPVTSDPQDNSAVAVRLQLLDREHERLVADQARIATQMNSYRVKVDAVPIREQQMAELDRNYSVSKEHYRSLLDKTFSAEMAADLERKQQAEHFTILDPAQVPERPFKPNRRLLLTGVLLLAVALSAGAASAKDRLDGSLKLELEIKALLPSHVPLLASVPRLRVAEDRRRSLQFAVLVALVTFVGCALETGLYLKLHRIL